jgi:hypothetical protein
MRVLSIVEAAQPWGHGERRRDLERQFPGWEIWYVRRSGQRRRDGMPSGLRVGAREAVRAASDIRQLMDIGARRVARGQY